MIRLTIEQVLHMHKMMIAETGGTDGVRDMGLLDMALNSAFQSFDGQDLYPTIEKKAARLAFSIVKKPSVCRWEQADWPFCDACFSGA